MTSEQEGSEVTHILIFQEATSVLKNLSPPDPPKNKIRDAFLDVFMPSKEIPKINLCFKLGGGTHSSQYQEPLWKVQVGSHGQG